MSRNTLLVPIALFLVGMECSAADFKRIDLTDPGDMEDAETIQSALDVLMEKVTECREANPDHSGYDCLCLYPKELEHLRSSYETSMKVHPAWEGQKIYWVRRKENAVTRSSSISFKGIRSTLARCSTHASVGAR